VSGSSNPFVAKEGIPFLALALVLVALALRYADPFVAVVPLIGFIFLVLLFRDPHRDVPPVALGIVSPVDGEVVVVDSTKQCVVQGEAYRIRIRINAFGTYTARSPVEGRVMDLRSKADGVSAECPANALWVETDEGNSVVLQFHEYRLGFAPQAFVGLGERLGQGQRCANVRLAQFAEVYLPIDGKVKVDVGQVVRAGETLIGAVPHP
jgi:phosphatidylserine decarboxylase